MRNGDKVTDTIRHVTMKQGVYLLEICDQSYCGFCGEISMLQPCTSHPVHTSESLVFDKGDDLLEHTLVAGSSIDLGSLNQSKELLQQRGEFVRAIHRMGQFEHPSMVVVALYARLLEFGFAGRDEEAIDWLAGGGSVEDPPVPVVTGRWQGEGFAGEGRQGRKVVVAQSENVSARVYTNVGVEQGEGEDVLLDRGVTDDHKHQVLPVRLPGLWACDRVCPILPLGGGGMHVWFW